MRNAIAIFQLLSSFPIEAHKIDIEQSTGAFVLIIYYMLNLLMKFPLRQN